MTCHFRILIFLAVFCLTTECARAQQDVWEKTRTVATEHALDRGLLLGIYSPKHASWDDLRDEWRGEKWVPEISTESHGQYLTIWISRTGGIINIRTVNGLLVPRNNGFWHVGAQMVRASEAKGENFEERLWALPADEKPPLPQLDPEISEAARGRSQGNLLITYVGPQYISYIEHWLSGIGGWEYRYSRVVSLDDMMTPLALEKVLGMATGAEYKRLAKSLDHMSEPDVCGCCTGDPTEWGLKYGYASLQAYARFHSGTSSSCSQGEEDHVLKAVGADGSANQPWEALKAEAEMMFRGKQGSFRYLFLSPKHDLAVALGTSALAVFGVEKLHITSLLKVQAFDVPCIPVMEQWSMGRFVSTWDGTTLKEPAAVVPSQANP